MRALQFAAFGGTDRLRLVALAEPVATATQAVIRVHAASVNPSDVKNVAGQMEGTTLPRVPGRDFSGVVEAGPAEWMGAEVWGTGGEIGFTEDGTHAERIGFPIAALVRKPANLSHPQASAIGVNFIVAWLGLIDQARLQAGETVAVIGAGGGVGGAVIQIAKARGCRVIGVGRETPEAGSPAGRLIDDFVAADAEAAAGIRRLTQGRGAAVVFDTVGGVMFETALAMLARRGRLVEISSTGRRRVEFDLVDFYHNESRLFGADSRKLDTLASAQRLAALVPGFESGAYLPPVVANTFRLEQGVLAYDAVAAGSAGRVVICP